jgi:hypothetical protein
MILATLLVMLTIVIFVCFQVACPTILRREFDREYSQPVINAARLEFRALRQSLGGAGASVDYRRVAGTLKCDFFTLCYLLRNGASRNQKYTNEERLLVLYFRWQLLSLATRQWLRVGEQQAAIRLTTVLEYFANVVGQRASLFYSPQFVAARPGSPRQKRYFKANWMRRGATEV